MDRPKRLRLDEIGYWSEVKLDIIREYASAYSRILASQTNPRLHHVYIDAFAGAGIHLSKTTGETIEGSPVIAANAQPSFKEYHFIDLDGEKIEHLRSMFAGRQDIHIYHGDCNQILLDKILPAVCFENYRRGLCLFDPYGLHLNWNVIRRCGEMKSIDLFLNFPIADMNRNVFWRNPEGVDEADIQRMSAFWGDESWRKVAYEPVQMLWGPEDEKTDNETIAAAFRERLRTVAGFKNVPEPIPMRNTTGAIVYYLFFASQKPVAKNIVESIFTKYRDGKTDHNAA
jgi:three-Cys-motif partner protein